MISYVNTIFSARLNVSANILFYFFIVNSTMSAKAKAYVSYIVYICFVLRKTPRVKNCEYDVRLISEANLVTV